MARQTVNALKLAGVSSAGVALLHVLILFVVSVVSLPAAIRCLGEILAADRRRAGLPVLRRG